MRGQRDDTGPNGSRCVLPKLSLSIEGVEMPDREGPG